jgi:photosystem II stability/assembly factor-like uncharacterized protein
VESKNLCRPLLKGQRLLAVCGLLCLLVATGRAADEDKAPYKVEVIEGLDTKVELTSVRAIDAKACVLVGAEGVIGRSDDAGKTWKMQKSNTTANLRDVRFISPQIGVAVGDGGNYKVPDNNNKALFLAIGGSYHVMAGDYVWSSIVRTQDGGKKWQHIEAPTNLAITGVAWMDKTHLVAITGDYNSNNGFPPMSGSMITSEDAGKTWKFAFGLGNAGRSIALDKDKDGWIVGSQAKKPDKMSFNGRDVKTIADLKPDELKTIPPDWKRKFTLPDYWNSNHVILGNATTSFKSDGFFAHASTICIESDPKGKGTLYGVQVAFDRAWVAGEGGLLGVAERKTKKWQPWKYMELEEGDKVTFRAVAFRDAKTGLVVGDGGACLWTLDGGTTWKRLQIEPQVQLNSIAFMGNDAIVVGNEGTILRLTREMAAK